MLNKSTYLAELAVEIRSGICKKLGYNMHLWLLDKKEKYTNNPYNWHMGCRGNAW